MGRSVSLEIRKSEVLGAYHSMSLAMRSSRIGLSPDIAFTHRDEEVRREWNYEDHFKKRVSNILVVEINTNIS